MSHVLVGFTVPQKKVVAQSMRATYPYIIIKVYLSAIYLQNL